MCDVRVEANQEVTEAFNSYARLVLSIVRKRLHGATHRSRLDSYSIRQEVFIGLLKKMRQPTFKPEEWHLAALLVKMANRRCAAWFRRKNLEYVNDPETLRLIVEAALEGTGGQPSEPEFLSVWHETVENAIGQVGDPLAREVIATWLDGDEDCTYADVAEQCNCSRDFVESAIKSLETVLRRSLRPRKRRSS